MERDYKYMTRTLDHVLATWMRCPHLRLTQLLHSALELPDPYYTEDNELVTQLGVYPNG